MRFTLLCLLLVQGLTINLFNLQTLTTKNGASCLDGSPFGIYTYEPDPMDFDVIPNKLVIYFEETPFGWCYEDTLANSYTRCRQFIVDDYLSDYGSSKNWGGSFMILTGMLSLDDPEFGAWPKVIVKSCDGGSYMGSRQQPITYKGTKMLFRGSNNVQEAIAFLKSKNFIQKREQVVLVGSLNAAIAALSWADAFQAATTGKVHVISDGGVYLDLETEKTKTMTLEKRIKNLWTMALEEGPTANKPCSLANPDAPWKCLFASSLAPFVTIDTIYLQSLYDGWAIKNVLGLSCAQQFASLSECTEQEREDIQAYQKQVRDVVGSLIDQGKSVFAIACVAHDFTRGRWDNDWFEVPMYSGNMVDVATKRWLERGRVVALDQVDWPHNQPCSRKVVLPNSVVHKQLVISN